MPMRKEILSILLILSTHSPIQGAGFCFSIALTFGIVARIRSTQCEF